MAAAIVLSFLLVLTEGGEGIRFVLERDECLSHSVNNESDTVRVSFVVIKDDDHWHFSKDAAVDLLIYGPSAEQISGLHHKTSGKYEFKFSEQGLYRFCFRNKSPYDETIDFDLQVGHVVHIADPARDEHFNPLLGQISKLGEARYSIQFEQHWLDAQLDHGKLVEHWKRRFWNQLPSLVLVSFRFSS